MSRRTVQGAVLSLVIVSGVLVSSAQDAKLAGRPAQANVPLTVDEVLGTPSVSNLVAAPSGRAVAWVLSDHGRRNVWVAEGDALRPRRLTTFAEDDGQSIQGLCWTPDARAVVFVRGAPTGASGAT
ncbi:MAG: hypothetical protein IMZ69_05445, partial [Spirochaetes bacterium]|nr:hypothetical protein [Spirochaetota bacterium]